MKTVQVTVKKNVAVAVVPGPKGNLNEKFIKFVYAQSAY